MVSFSYGMWPGGETESRGLEEIVGAVTGWLREWERPFVIAAEEFVEHGDRIAVFVRWTGQTKGGGRAIEAENTHLWEFRDGKAVRFDVYGDRDEALRALRDEGA